jgi:hypothetical protein
MPGLGFPCWFDSIGSRDDAAGFCVAGARSRSSYCRVQAHPGPHWHCGPQAHTAFGTACCIGRLWQPQAQLWPGQLVQVHGFWVVAFIVFLL